MAAAAQVKIIIYGTEKLLEDPLLINVFTGKTAPPGDRESLNRQVVRICQGQTVEFHGHGWDVLTEDVVDGRVMPWLLRHKDGLTPGFKVVA